LKLSGKKLQPVRNHARWIHNHFIWTNFFWRTFLIPTNTISRICNNYPRSSFNGTLKCCNDIITRLTKDSESYKASTQKDIPSITMDSFHNDSVAMASSIGYATFDDAALDDFHVDRTSLDDTSIDCQSAQAHTPSGNTCSPYH
jgi:hypothetical protein